jgi:two-component system OmpR family sensor kinase/two-component system sensor histidine kinase QseC
MHSLRLRLFALLLALAAVAALAVGGATYLNVRAQTDELFDYHLRQMALSLRDQGGIAERERAALANPDLDYVVQIWSLDGVSLYTSRPRPLTGTLPARAVLGYATVRLEGRDWRLFSAATPFRVVQVGQPLAVRRELAARAAGRGVLPIVVAAPLVGWAMWGLVGVTLAPLRRVVAAASRREPHSLQALPTADLPTELQPLIDAFNRLLARLAAAFDAQRAFVGDAAHELRTPLAALKLQVGLLHGAADEAERERSIQRLRAGVDRATRLVEQLLTLARAEPGPAGAATHEPVDLVAVARQALADASALAAAHQATLHADLPAPPQPPVRVRGHAEALRSLLRNLIDNAILHGGRPPEVWLSLDPRDGDDGVRLRVDDNGPGIPEAERGRVFDRFYRSDAGAASPAIPGSGLGLAIVQAIARLAAPRPG